jgi:hypothetical protein
MPNLTQAGVCVLSTNTIPVHLLKQTPATKATKTRQQGTIPLEEAEEAAKVEEREVERETSKWMQPCCFLLQVHSLNVFRGDKFSVGLSPFQKMEKRKMCVFLSSACILVQVHCFLRTRCIQVHSLNDFLSSLLKQRCNASHHKYTRTRTGIQTRCHCCYRFAYVARTGLNSLDIGLLNFEYLDFFNST